MPHPLVRILPVAVRPLVCVLLCLLPCSICCRCDAKPVQETEFEAAGTKFVTLPDGRKLEYMVGGDLNGTAMLCFGEQFGTSLVRARVYKGYGGPFLDEAEKNNIKVIAVTVPGFGLSDGYPLGMDRSLHAFPGDVRYIVKAPLPRALSDSVPACVCHGG